MSSPCGEIGRRPTANSGDPFLHAVTWNCQFPSSTPVSSLFKERDWATSDLQSLPNFPGLASNKEEAVLGAALTGISLGENCGWGQHRHHPPAPPVHQHKWTAGQAWDKQGWATNMRRRDGVHSGRECTVSVKLFGQECWD